MPAYALTNVDGKWWAEGALDSGRKVRFECGQGSKDAAEAVAAMKWERRLQSAAASRKRWDAPRAGAAAASSAPASKRASSPERNAAIRGKLLALGDASELPGDDDAGDDVDDVDEGDAGGAGGADYIPPDGERPDDDDDDEEGEDDEEAAELLADVIGNGIYSGVTGGVTKLLKRAKPPREPGEPHELFVRYGREGCCYRVRKLIGKGAKLSPNGKLLVGLAGTIITMIWNSEVIGDDAAASAEKKPKATPAPAPRAPAAAAPSSPDAPPPHANGVAKEDRPARLALVRTDVPDSPPEDPLGSFS